MTPEPRRSKLARAAWLLLGFTALGLGAAGAILPLLPTTPFLLVAAFAFARSSDRWHAWLMQHKVFGPLIADWQAHGAIARGTKIVSVVTMVAVLGLSIALRVPLTVLLIQAVFLSGSAIFVLSRPLPPEQD